MKDFPLFFKNSLKLGLLVTLIVLGIPKLLSPIISESNHYVASTIDKENRLNKIKSPKIIIVGGSGSAYSINSETLQDSLKMPVVNMAVAYGLGLTFMLEEVKKSIQKGDKILLFIEYNLPLSGNTKLLTLVNDLNPNASEYFKFNAQDWLKFKVSNFQRVGSSLFYKIKNLEKEETTTKRSSFNELGDMVGHLNLPNVRPLKDQEKLYNNPYKNEITALNSFVKVANELGAKVYFGFPAYPKSEFDKNKSAINYFEKKLKANFQGVILNSPEENLYEENEFYDTIYHLNGKGRAKRTQYLIKILKKLN